MTRSIEDKCGAPFGLPCGLRDQQLFVVLLRRDLPSVGTRLGGLGYGKSGRSELRNDIVEMTAAVADHKDVFMTPWGNGVLGTFKLSTMLPVQSELTV